MVPERLMKMKMSMSKVVKILQEEKFWNVIPSGNEIRLVRQFGFITPKIIEFSLVSTKTGYEIKHPNYLYTNKISHFKAVQKDTRLSLNKIYLSTIINTLKKTGIWPHIVNRNFITVNTANIKSEKPLVRDQLQTLLKL